MGLTMSLKGKNSQFACFLEGEGEKVRWLKQALASLGDYEKKHKVVIENTSAGARSA